MLLPEPAFPALNFNKDNQWANQTDYKGMVENR